MAVPIQSANGRDFSLRREDFRLHGSDGSWLGQSATLNEMPTDRFRLPANLSKIWTFLQNDRRPLRQWSSAWPARENSSPV